MPVSFSFLSRYSMEKEAENENKLRKELYPFAVQMDALIPSQWNPKDKHMFMKLSHGPGKSHKDAAAVRADFSVPVACGLFYFEITIISKGRDGLLNGIECWDKRSYGYHGDDGNSFASSGTGFPYGPTFTTGDVIGCGVNMENRTCFYTKNGINLGLPFFGLNLFPIVGLQTPGEVVEANFGQSPFVYNIMDDILVTIRSCIMDGQISQAISLLEKHFPMVIDNDMQMKHLLMCWQFIEIFSENSYEVIVKGAKASVGLMKMLFFLL
ncbi:SPRY domain containing protein [Trichuris trichiura]|uniref:SPRY domain containing protein n=1 Tax=Trichuris trichiura TaxID=36087 RepID=A0A077ZNN3_TRITR|nr:SPRY domain containing protein [Trichuris trichiura]